MLLGARAGLVAEVLVVGADAGDGGDEPEGGLGADGVGAGDEGVGVALGGAGAGALAASSHPDLLPVQQLAIGEEPAPALRVGVIAVSLEGVVALREGWVPRAIFARPS